MGADLFESYVGSIIGTMVLGAALMGAMDNSINPVILPLVLAGAGIITSIIGTFLVKVKEGGDPQKACPPTVSGRASRSRHLGKVQRSIRLFKGSIWPYPLEIKSEQGGFLQNFQLG